MKNVLITGICGMVGSHLADFLLEKTDWKIQLDNKVCHNCVNSNQQTSGNYNQQTNRAINNLKINKNLCNNCGNYL